MDKQKFEDIKGQSEAVNRRRTDDTIDKRKGANNDLQNTTQKIKN